MTARARPLPALALALLLAAPLAGAHWSFRHDEHPGPRTGPGDVVTFAGAASAEWLVVSPDLVRMELSGGEAALPPGRIVDGTWSLRVNPVGCGPGPWVLGFAMAGIVRAYPLAQCAGHTWVFNWLPAAIPPSPGSFPPGTILMYGPGATFLDSREAQEPTFYQGLTPYYNLDSGDSYTSDYKLLGANGNPLSERSGADTDDDGDGVPNRGDPDLWAGVWLDAWARRMGFPRPPMLPRADLLAEDAERRAARDHPGASALLREEASYRTSDTRGEAPAQTPAGAVERLTFRVHNLNASAPQRLLTSLGAGYVHRSLRDVLLDVPALPDGQPAFAVDLAATRAALPEGWAAALWQGRQGARLLLQAEQPFYAVFTGGALDLPVVARAAAYPGTATWEATLLFGPVAPERRFAFLVAEVVS